MTTTTFTTTAPARLRFSARRRGPAALGRIARSTREGARVTTGGSRTELRPPAVIEAVAAQRIHALR